MAGHGGGAWKVAYADFVTAMMAFFMVMWLISQNEKVKQAVAKHFRNESGKYAIGDSLMSPRHDQYFRDRRPPAVNGDEPPPDEVDLQKTRNPNVLALNNGERTIVGTAVFFTEPMSDLDDAAKRQLDAFIPIIVGKPQKIEIRGHAARRTPNMDAAVPDGWQLSYLRCLATMKYLEERGIPLERFRLSQSGPYEPCSVREVPKKSSQNSRVEVFLLNEAVEDNFGTREELLLRYKTL